MRRNFGLRHAQLASRKRVRKWARRLALWRARRVRAKRKTGALGSIYSTRSPEMARAMTKRWISLVPSKIVELGRADPQCFSVRTVGAWIRDALLGPLDGAPDP